MTRFPMAILAAAATVLVLGGTAYANPARDTVPGAITEPHILWLGTKGFPMDGAKLPAHVTAPTPATPEQSMMRQDEPERPAR